MELDDDDDDENEEDHYQSKKLKNLFYLIDAYESSTTAPFNIIAFECAGVESKCVNGVLRCRVNPFHCKFITNDLSVFKLFSDFILFDFPQPQYKRSSILTPSQQERKEKTKQQKKEEKEKKESKKKDETKPKKKEQKKTQTNDGKRVENSAKGKGTGKKKEDKSKEKKKKNETKPKKSDEGKKQKQSGKQKGGQKRSTKKK